MTEIDTSRKAVERLIAPIREHLEAAEARVNRLQYIEATIRVNALHQGATNDQIEDFLTGKQSFIEWMAGKIEAKPAIMAQEITAAFEEIERIYYMEGKDAVWRAAHMRAVAQEMLRALRKGSEDD